MTPSATSAGWRVREWPDADRIFRGDPRWKGSDCAYSVHLGGDRVLWLFNDTFVAPGDGGPRLGAPMLCNTVAIQRGLDPVTATMRFAWREVGGAPSAFFPRREDAVLWPGPGVMVGSHLLLAMRWISLTGGAAPWGFRYAGDLHLLVENPHDEPERWRTRSLDCPPNPWGIELGTGSLLAHGDHVLLFCPDQRHDVRIARWPLAAVADGDLSGLQWWCGDGGWRDAARLDALPAVVLPAAQSEFSVHRLADGRFLQVQARGVTNAVIAVRSAPAAEGPWSEMVDVHAPAEAVRPEVFCYAVKAHPHIPGADVVLTYASNLEVGDVAADETVYWPRFLRLSVPS